MRFVLANVAVFLFLSATLIHQYFYQSPLEAVELASVTADRTPAAAPENVPLQVPLKALPEKKQIDIDLKMNLSCRDSHRDFTQASKYLILNLKKCAKDFPKQISIENLSNGFTASLFALNESFSKTDSIPLKKGKNEIVIKYFFSKNRAKSETEVIERVSVQTD